MNLFSNNKLFIIVIFFLGLSLRLYGLNWDQGNHLHPDERFLTMVTNDIKLPSSIFEYFDTNSSPLNPYNYPQYQFFVYGTFPIFLTKFLVVVFNIDNYDKIVLLGRFLSALFDSLNIFLLYFLSRKRISPSLFYSLIALPIQLSHFFAVDTFLSTFILATFTLLTYNLFLPAAITFGLALSSKISAIIFAPIFFLFIINQKKLSTVLRITFYVLLFTFLVFRIFNPYVFTSFFNLNPLFIENLETLKSFSDPGGWFPPAVQWLSKTPIIFPVWNIVIFGLGLPMTILFLWSLRHLNKEKILWLSLIWIILIILIQGSQFAHSMRYFLPIYPFITLIALWNRPRFVKLILVSQFVIALSFITIYSVPHSRVQASWWIHKNIPIGSTISSEYWDDPLPLGYSSYQSLSLPLYDPDTPEKWQKIDQQLDELDYLIMSSNRLWGSIPLVPNRYPLASKFYQDIFNEKQNFQKLVEINSYPGFRLPLDRCYYFGPTNMPGNHTWFETNICEYPGIYFRDDIAEEAFTVYDHPKILIFAKKN